MRQCLLQGQSGIFIPRYDKGCYICGMHRLEPKFVKYHPLAQENIEGDLLPYRRLEMYPHEYYYLRYMN